MLELRFHHYYCGRPKNNLALRHVSFIDVFSLFSVRSRQTEVDVLEAADPDLFSEQQRQLEDLLNAESSAASTKSTIITGKSK